VKVVVRFSPQALAQVQAAHAWWKKNRPRAPRLFRDELAEALELLRTAPTAGAPYPHRRLRDVRRVILQRSRYYVSRRRHDPRRLERPPGPRAAAALIVARNARSAFSKSAGSALSHRTLFPVAGCTKPSTRACSA
jgi:plasmid stabilization system protein ParE